MGDYSLNNPDGSNRNSKYFLLMNLVPPGKAYKKTLHTVACCLRMDIQEVADLIAEARMFGNIIAVTQSDGLQYCYTPSNTAELCEHAAEYWHQEMNSDDLYSKNYFELLMEELYKACQEGENSVR